MDFNLHIFNFVVNQKIYSLWEKETKNQEEVRLMPEVMAKEDQENLQNLPKLLKKQRAKNKMTED